MRASTLATFELVTTLPETRSPGCTVVALMAMASIWGAASGARCETFLAIRGAAGDEVAAAPGVGVMTGGVTGTGDAVGVG